jgi:hypothetical protein
VIHSRQSIFSQNITLGKFMWILVFEGIDSISGPIHSYSKSYHVDSPSLSQRELRELKGRFPKDFSEVSIGQKSGSLDF